MRLQFLAKYRETGLLLLRVSLGMLLIIYVAPVLMAGTKSWAQFGTGMRHFGIHSHFQWWGFLGAAAACLGAVLMIFGLFFRIGVLICLLVAILHAIGVVKGAGLHAALPSMEACVILFCLLFIGPGKYSVDKT